LLNYKNINNGGKYKHGISKSFGYGQ